MSLWKIGVDDVSQETQQFKDKLASKDGHIAAQQAQLMKQAKEFEELKASLNEALQKLAKEGERVLHLEEDLKQCRGDLRDEKNAARNIEASLQAANDKLKTKDVETRDLEATLERLSGTSNDHNNRSTKLGNEKTVLENRIRELEANLRQLSAAAASSRRVPLRTSSDQFNGLRVNQLEKEYQELQEGLKKKDDELSGLRERLSHAQDELLRVDNERTAKEAKTKSELEEMRSLLREKDEELEFYKNQGDGEREEMLLQRIEEDGAKIAAYEAILKQSDDAKGLKERLRSVEQRLKVETTKVADLESRNIVLVQEREEAFTELEDVRVQMHVLEDRIREHEIKFDTMKEERSRLALAISEQDSQRPDDVDTESVVNGVDVTHVARLLEAIVRLRGERDDLRRRLQFLEMEHKFAVEALEKRLPDTSAAVDVSNSRVAQPNVDDVQSKDGKIRRLASSAAACAVLLLHSQTQLEGCTQLLSDSWEREQYVKSHADAEAEKCLALEDEVDQIVYQLKESEERARDLETELGVKDAEWEDMKGSCKYLQDRTEKLEADFEEMSRTLEIVESERNSLALQVENLTTDLQAAQDELENAEGRYSALQFQQLSSMTSNEVTRALRDQIAELEGRVMRRTELVGVHQHDIKRLETNLRLQEERLAEMTMELETLATQKEAMLEDCADAREARDEALAQIETLEVELENTEFRLFDNDKTLNALICLLVQSASSAQHTQARISELEVDLYESQVTRDMLEVDLVDMQATQADFQQATVALATTQLEFSNIVARVQSLIVEKDGLARELAFVSQQVEEQEGTNRRLREECATLRRGSSTSVTQLVAKSSEYQIEIEQLNKIISETKAESEASQQRLARSEIELEKVQQEKKRVVAEREEITSDLIQAHKREMEVLQKDLSAASAVLEEERTNRVMLEQERMEALAQAQSKVDGLEKRAEALNQELSQLSSSQDDLQTEREKALQQLETLRTELEGLLVEKVKAEEVQRDLTITNEHLSEELAQLRKERETATLGAKSHADQRQQELESQKVELQSKIDELACAAENATQEIQHISQELDQERQRMRDNETRYDTEMQSLIHERDVAQLSLSKLQKDIIELQDTIECNETALATSEGEKDRLQENITGLEAQVQKLLSYTHSLERQVEDGERALEILKTNLNNTGLELSRAETTAKTAEMNLSLQSAQFKRELAKLQDKLAALEARHDLEEALTSLEERNNEMEELLKAKCAEIEENDDRALEMLKENKKLSSKVEALTRKVQNLQTKLTAAKAAVANAKATGDAVPVAAAAAAAAAEASPPPLAEAAEIQTKTTRRRSTRLSSSTIVSQPLEKSLAASSSKPPTSRVVSGPSTGTLRPKTPERRLAPTPVFKLRTPEQPRAQERTSESTQSVVGVKRRAPDDFESYESVPPQGFTADSLPSRENEGTTTKVRRTFGNLQSGFTPIRNKALSSPKRQSAVPSTLIQDVTNSPRSSVPLDSAKQSKRSWLGKIRGTSAPAAVRPASRQVFTFMDETHRP